MNKHDPILSLEKKAMERWRSGDPWGFVELSAEEITYIDPGLTKHIHGLGEYKAYMQQIEGKVIYQRSEFIDPKVLYSEKAAVLTYNYRSSAIDAEGRILRQTPWNSTEVYTLINGQWRIVHTHWSFINQKLPEIVEVPLPIHLPHKVIDGLLDEIMSIEGSAMERWRNGDPWGFIDISSPEVTYFDVSTTKRINGKEALSALYSEIEGKVFYEVMDFIDPTVQACGDLAVLSYRFLSTRLNPDGSISSRTPWNCSEVYLKIDNKWCIVHTHWSYINGERL